jgi:SAM-dependent methyltransferase
VYGAGVRLAALLDPWLYRHPFEGQSAVRYRGERAGFGDLDVRLLASWRTELTAARVVLDIGSGPALFTKKVAAAYPDLRVIAIEPAAAFAHPSSAHASLRARAEALPLRDGCADVAVCLSSLRHVRDRTGALAELRRVLGPMGVAFVVELDPSADRQRKDNHRRALPSALSRLAFGPLVCGAAPSQDAMAQCAGAAGWRRMIATTDPVQPVYVLRLEK